MGQFDTRYVIEVFSVQVEQKSNDDGSRSWESCIAKCRIEAAGDPVEILELQLPPSLKDVQPGKYYAELGLYRTFDRRFEPAVVDLKECSEVDAEGNARTSL